MPEPTYELACPTAPVTTGAYRLGWQGPSTEVVVTEQTPSGESIVIYRGTDEATTISGRTAGSRSYQLLVDNNEVASCRVEVAPPSWALVIALFSAGLVVTALTIVLVIRGHREHCKGLIG